jgi:dihydrofolate synthase / folylpolyglutamate synthase
LDIDTLLRKFEHFGIKLGLTSIQQFLADLGNPQTQVPIIHVAGSNGKGSVCAYLSAVLTHAGYRVGRYTSPHLVSWCERICINEQPISEADLLAVLQQVQAAIRSDRPSPTQFEVITAAMWLYFAQQQVDIAIVEVGLGGRLDATNVCDQPLVSVIVSISREHWQRLGSTLGEIAGEKAGILKPHCPAVIGQLPAEAQAVVAQRIAELNCPVVYPEPAVEDGWGAADSGVTAQGIHYQLPLPGAIQRHNSALAIAALKILQQQGWQHLTDQAIAEGIAQTKWPGRLQWLTWQGRKILVDGAHNPASAVVLRHYVESILQSPSGQSNLRGGEEYADSLGFDPAAGVNWVIGMLSTKDHREVFEALLRSGDGAYCVPVPDPISAPLDELAVLARSVCPDLQHCQGYPDVFAGLAAATAQPGLTVLCGSLYLLGSFFARSAL